MNDRTGLAKVSRRKFGVMLAASSAAAPDLVAQQQERSDAMQHRDDRPPSARKRPSVAETPPFPAELEFARKQASPKAKPFPMTQVRLLPGSVFHDAYRWNRGYLSRLTPDRLLYTFRANVGLPVGSVTPLGGWEQPENGKRASELRGHFAGGHFLSASAQLAANGDQEAKQKGDYIVAELAKCQRKLGGKYLSAYPTSWFDRLERGERVWAPFYTIHKIMAGMLDMYRLAGNTQALEVLEGMAAWADEWTARKSAAEMQQILKIEFGGIAETLYSLAAETGNDRWARTGDRFQKRSFLNPLGLRRDELRGLHANTHIPQAIAAARRYEISSDMRFHDVAEYFFSEVTRARTYVTGGTSTGESWLSQPRRLAAEWRASVNTQECCCAYNMLKLARHLYSWNPEPAYFDYYERLLLNHRLGTIRPDIGTTQYYLSLAPGAWKTFGTEDQTFWCCTGSGVEEYSKLSDSIYWQGDDGLFVNLFIPSELDWSEKGVKLRQETKYPESETTTLTVSEAQPEPLALRLRIPRWLRTAPTVKLNGRALDASAAPGGYLTLNRTWTAGDKIEMELPMHLHAEAMPDDADIRAYLYGPLVLAGDLGSEGLTEAHISGPNLRVGARNAVQNGSPLGPPITVPPVPEIEIPTFRAAGDPSSWIKPADEPHSFRTSGQTKNVKLVPINRLFGRRYSVYWQTT